MTSETPADPATPESQASPENSLDARGLLQKLQEISPTFRDCKPVALRIDKSIGERFPDVDRKTVRTAMRIHTASTRYLKAMEKGTHRFDLDGNEDGEVTEEHRAHAAQTLKERFAEAERRRRDKRRQEQERQRAEEAERRKAEKMQQLLSKFSRD